MNFYDLMIFHGRDGYLSTAPNPLSFATLSSSPEGGAYIQLPVCSRKAPPSGELAKPQALTERVLPLLHPADGFFDDGVGKAAAALVDSRYRKKLAIGRRDLVVAALQRCGFAYPVIKEAIRRVEEGE